MNNTTSIIPWQGSGGIVIDSTANDITSLSKYAIGLKEKEVHKIISAFNNNYFDMGTEFIWRKSINKLKTTISSLGMKFIGEILERSEVDEYTSPDKVLTEFDTIKLAESLGIINKTGTLRLRHSQELMSHFFTEDVDEELSLPEAIYIVKTCIQYVLGEQDIKVAVDFSRFRKRVVSETLTIEDQQLQQLISSPLFFIKTTLRVMIASIKTEIGAPLEHVLANFNLILPLIWLNLSEEDKWLVGTTYAEISSSAPPNIIQGIKQALLKVSGFDYVPENLRSNTYKKIAQLVLNAHQGFNNFYLEYAPIKQLAELGTTIPPAAFSICMQAYLCVFLGNYYGRSFNAYKIAENEIKKMSSERWAFYLNKILQNDDIILYKLTEEPPTKNFINLCSELKFEKLSIDNIVIKKIIDSAIKNDVSKINDISRTLWGKLRNA